MICDLPPVDMGMEIGWQLANVADWQQTLHIAHYPEQYAEASAQHWIGAHPDTAKVNMYFAATGVGHALITCNLQNIRKVWLGVTLVEKITIVTKNKKIGLRVTWSW